jgi:hypothetical protein
MLRSIARLGGDPPPRGRNLSVELDGHSGNMLEVLALPAGETPRIAQVQGPHIAQHHRSLSRAGWTASSAGRLMRQRRVHE